MVVLNKVIITWGLSYFIIYKYFKHFFIIGPNESQDKFTKLFTCVRPGFFLSHVVGTFTLYSRHVMFNTIMLAYQS